MSRRAPLAVLLLGVLLALPAIAHATPTDPVWISGLYDDSDYDDVVLFIIAAVSLVDSAVVDHAGPVVVCLGLIVPGRPRPVLIRSLAPFSTRAPPDLST
jgi:hypothetical protein